MKKSAFYYWVLVFLSLGLCACFGSKGNKKNIAYEYKKVSAKLKVWSKVHHISDEETSIYMGVSSNKLQFNADGEAEIVASFRVYNHKNAALIDTATVKLLAKKTNKAQTVFRHTLPIAAGAAYHIDISLTDPKAGKIFTHSLKVWKEEDYGAQNDQNYLVKAVKSKQILLENYAPQGTALQVIYRKNPKADYTIQYFKPSTQLALPPFVNKKRAFPNKPDSTFTCNGAFVMDKVGMYYFTHQKNQEIGGSMVCVDKDFPKLTSANDLIESLRYITRNEEFKTIEEAEDTKKAIDDFWLKRAGSFDRGKVLIQEFYGRVQRANQYFTTWQEGWKTDMGLIYVIYGEPDIVYKYYWGEEWIYSADNSSSKSRQNFLFNREKMRYSTQQHSLERDSNNEDSWHLTVYEWRKGIIRNVSSK